MKQPDETAKRNLKVLAAFLVSVLLVLAGGFAPRVKAEPPVSDGIEKELQYVISDFVAANSRTVKNCVVSVKIGDGSLSWSSAAGIANTQSQTPMTPETPIFIASVTKLYTAAAVMRLYETGKIDLDDPIAKYLPVSLVKGIHVFEGKDYTGELTVRHLLSHSSGLPDYYTDKAKDGQNLFEKLVEQPERSWTVEETIVLARNALKPHFAPGAGASYADTNYQLLGKIIESVTGKPLPAVFREFFFEPLGLQNTWMVGPAGSSAALPADVYWKDRNITKTRFNGVYWADGGIVSTAQDGVVFLKALREGRIVKPETLALMQKWRKLDFPLQYGLGIMYVEFPWYMQRMMKLPPVWGHSGSTGSFLYYCEKLDLYLSGTINATDEPSKPFRLMGKVASAMESYFRGKKPSDGGH
ncbi:MAG: beta-lactamase family protein [Deltaproteobacteria bacterium]|nr:beta-lactamase family protein [Deltaproteobacteria bacterium]